MIHSEIDEETTYTVARMLDYEMENLRIDTYAKAELLVMFKYVLEHVKEYREQMPEEVEREYEETCRSLLKRRV